MDKQALRKKHKELRKSLTEEQREQYSIAIANNALKMNIWDYEYYHIFLPIERHLEVNTQYLLSILQGKDKNVVVSKSDFRNNEMTNYLLTDSTRIQVNNFGIPEPEGGISIENEKLEVVFIPLLAYDCKGNRVGYGKGFYDRFLAKCSNDIVKIGVSFFEPEEQFLSIKNTDISMNYCISPKKAHFF